MYIKKIVSLILSFALLCVSFCFVNASEIVEEGKCGPTVSYKFYADGTMVIEGTGTVRQGNFPKEITSLVISEGITSIGNYVFSSCTYLEKVSLPESLSAIGDMAFYSSGLKEIIIPKNVEKIGSMALSACFDLKKIIVHEGNENFESQNGALFNEEKSVLISYPGGLTGKYVLPSGVSEISSSAFYSSKLSEIVLPDSLLIIGEEAFARSFIKKIVVPENVSEIKGKAFENCGSLLSAVIKSKQLNIGDFAFYYCTSLEEIEMGNGVEYIGEYSFSECSSLKNVVFSENFKSVGNYAFYNCDNLERIKIPENVESLGKRSFSNCDVLLNIVVCSPTTEIGEKAFGFNDGIRMRDTVVYGFSGSTAEKYSLYTFKFIDLSTSGIVFTSDNIFVSDGYIFGIEEKTKVSALASFIANNDFYAFGEDENVSTGMELYFDDEKYVFVVKGDADGNGIVNSTDYLQIKKAFLGEYSLENEYFKAADTDEDAVLTSTDYLKIKNHFLGTKSLY